MLVYRIENQEGWGPWLSDAIEHYNDARVYGPDPYEHPGPRDIREYNTKLYGFFNDKTNDVSDFIFGVQSKELLLTWFPCQKGRKEMETWGSEIKVYETEDVFEGLFQCVFNKHTAKLVGYLDMGTLKFHHV